MREFRPPVKSSVMRLVFALALGAMMLAGCVMLAMLASGSGQVTYEISSGTLVVDSGSRFDGQRTIPLALIHDAHAVTLRGARRTRGTGMPGYCTGHWSYKDIGPVWQATNCSGRAVLLAVAGEELPILVTPPDPEGFVRQIEAGADMRIALPKADSLLLVVVPAGGSVLLALVGAMVLATLLLGPARMRYLVGEGRLEVRTLFSRRSWPATELRARAHTPGAVRRVAGTAVGGYYTGRFRADGESTRVYATDLTACVLVEGPQRILLSPEDRSGFLGALREAGAKVEG